MNNFNLKYLVIGVILISLLMIAGVYAYSLITKPQPAVPTEQNPQVTPSAIPNTPDNGGPGGEK